jgi:hypothetical protein
MAGRCFRWLRDVAERPYARLYLDLVDDPKFAGIYENDHHFAAWCRLLMIAEGAWPASAHLPSGRLARPSSVRVLSESTLIDARPGDRYRVHGLDNEREARADRARTSVAHRRDRSNNDRTTTVERPYIDRSTSRAEPSQDEQSRDTHTAHASDPADVYWTLTGRYPSEKVVGWIDDLGSRFGAETVIRALAKAHIEDRSTNTLMGRVDDILRSEARALSLKAQEAERQRLKERRAAPREIVDQAAVQQEIERILRGEAA